MKREYRMDPDTVVERRLGYAAARNAHVPDTEIWQKLRTLPPGETTDGERLRARITVARFARRLHWSADVERDLIDKLGLGGDVG